MMPFDDILERLALTFSARDVMVQMQDLVCAANEETAREYLETYPDFDVIPILNKKKEIVAYFQREAGTSKSIRYHDIVSDSTSILDLVSILQNRKFCFVQVRNEIAGYIHFSDLNKGIVKLPYFLILQDSERRLADKIGPRIHEDILEEVLDLQRTNILKERMRSMKRERSDLGWVNLLSFNEIIRFAQYFKIVQLEPPQIDVLSRVRNSVYHADRPLVEKDRDVRHLVEARRICTSLPKI